MPPLKTSSSTGLTITNPLILYRTLLATKQIDPDPSQHRLALHLQTLYYRLKDYSPETEYSNRLNALKSAVNATSRIQNDPFQNADQREVAVPSHPLRNNPLFRHLFKRKEDRDTRALTRVLTSHEKAMELDSPRGLLLHGEVGTGKSMLIDLLADSLPTEKKRRWHFNTFMLEVLSRLEALRQARYKSLYSGNSASTLGIREEGADEGEWSMLWLAKEMIEKNPILFLDEFQLPDRAAAKILSHLLTAFFQLGGVVVATSNRMPDELMKASGVSFAPMMRSRGMRGWLGLSAGPGRASADAGTAGEYAGFLGVLKARCETWDMEGGRDWRRREAEGDTHFGVGEMSKENEELREALLEDKVDLKDLGGAVKKVPVYETSSVISDSLKDLDETQSNEDRDKTVTIPKKYLLASSSSPVYDSSTWTSVVQSTLPSETPSPVPWKPTSMFVYGRTVPVPRSYAGVTYWTFPELCGSTFGPADYITLASTFHTLILDSVPILTLSQRNEARRLITLLDALYEARCKLVIRAEAGPDELFFPEIAESESRSASFSGKETGTSDESDASGRKDENDGQDAVYPETLSEIYQDQTSPFRPNISSYTDSSEPFNGPTGYDPDGDPSDFTHPGAGHEIGRKVDFGATSSFTGEDERFAYKRARSRLWEMCGGRWHGRGVKAVDVKAIM